MHTLYHILCLNPLSLSVSLSPFSHPCFNISHPCYWKNQLCLVSAQMNPRPQQMVNQKIFSFVSRHRGAPILNLCRYHHTVNQRFQVSQVFRKDHRKVIRTIQDEWSFGSADKTAWVKQGLRWFDRARWSHQTNTFFYFAFLLSHHLKTLFTETNNVKKVANSLPINDFISF